MCVWNNNNERKKRLSVLRMAGSVGGGERESLGEPGGSEGRGT